MTIEILLSTVLLTIILGLVMLYQVIGYLREVRSQVPRQLADILSALSRLDETARRIPQASQFAFPGFGTKHFHEGPPPEPDKFIIWQWRDEKWVAVEFPKEAGPGSPPNVPGKFEGDSIRTSIEDAAR